MKHAVLAVLLAAGCSSGGAASHPKREPTGVLRRTSRVTGSTTPKTSVSTRRATPTSQPVREHSIADLDGDGQTDIVRTGDPDAFDIRVRLQLSGGTTCEIPPSSDGAAALVDVIGANNLDGAGTPELWVEFGVNNGSVVEIAKRDGCTLHFLPDQSSQPWKAYIFTTGHVCCPDSADAVRCVTQAGYVEIITTDSGLTQPPIDPAVPVEQLPFSWSRHSFRLRGDSVVTVASDHGEVARRDLLSPDLLAQDLDCSPAGR